MCETISLLLQACELCCKEPGEGNPCMSSFQLNVPPLDVPDMYSKPGTPCNNYQGYCDVFQKCREVTRTFYKNYVPVNISMSKKIGEALKKSLSALVQVSQSYKFYHMMQTL